jgi:Aerotolerance regulator N-terminal/von Willebrand factor type A domain
VPITLLNAALLFGLVAVVIPPIIHLLNRKRFEVVRWGAMRFLQVSERTRRRVFLEELLLMLVRMGLIAVMVLALAAPADRSGWFRLFGDRGSRDVVVIFDGSYSMAYAGKSGTAHAAAQKWALDLLDDLGPGDGVAVLQAKQQVFAPVAEPTCDFDLVRSAIRTLSAPRGGCDWPAALQAATRCFAKSTKLQREIVLLTDGQRHGWADDATFLRWELLAGQQSDGDRPRIWVVNLDPNRPAAPANWSLAPLRASRAVAAVGQHVRFLTGLERHGEGELAVPQRVKLEVDGRAAGDVPPVAYAPGSRANEKERLPLTVRQRFTAAGSHLVTVLFDGDPLPGDNRQDYAVEVLPALPVLLVDGDPDPDATRRGVDFLRDALAPARDPSPSVVARVVSIADFAPDLLTRDVAGGGTVPRVAVLSNVARFTPAQEAAIGKFVADGGGLLVTLGDRVDTRHYNQFLYRGGRGWLPAALLAPVGDVNDTARAAQPLATSLFHPALELFRESVPGGLADARFPRRWTLKTEPADNAVAIARLTGDTPLFVERPYQSGRVLLSSVPLDNSWRTNLIELPAFAPLAHELVFYLAAARSAAGNLNPGQPIRFPLPKDASTDGWTIQPPDSEPKPLAATDGQLVFDDTREPGVYRVVHAATAQTRYFVVQADARESDLTPASDADRQRIRKLFPTLVYTNDRREVIDGLLRSPQPTELWWLVMLAVIGLLGVEVWLTRRRAQAALA